MSDFDLQRTIDEDETGADGEDEHRWTKRTQNVLNSISTKIKASTDGKVRFSLQISSYRANSNANSRIKWFSFPMARKFV